MAFAVGILAIYYALAHQCKGYANGANEQRLAATNAVEDKDDEDKI
jgi:hypothetical protein